MKPIYLEFCGINSFSEKTQIDFRALLSGGVFGIFGDTGSGKSTILDCIHLALYGVIERASKSMVDCINYNLDSAYVTFDFEITTEGVRHLYRVRRERKRKNGTAKAFLYEAQGDEWLALAEGTRDVDDAVEKIIGLNFNDFKMCIALPQGDFAALVKAATAERVKLVSRLFDLEKYGEKLSKAVNEKYYRAEQEVEVIKAEMGQNEGGRDEIIEEKRAEIALEMQALAYAEEGLKQAEIVYENAMALQKEKLQYDEICKKLETLTAQLPEMEIKRKAAEKLPNAKMVDDKAKTLENNRAEKTRAELAVRRAEDGRLAAVSDLEKIKSRLNEEDFDDKILKISVQLDKVRGAAKDVEEAEKSKRRLEECIAQYNLLRKKCPEEDFAEKRAVLEAELSALGEDDTLLDYLKHNYKGVLLAEEYGEMRKDLRRIAEKYPQTQADVETLLKKYASQGDKNQTLDVAKVQLVFKQIEQQRKLVKKSLEDLETRKRAYDENEAKKALLIEQGKVYRQDYDAANEKIAFIKDMGTAKELEERLKAVQSEKNAAQKLLEETQEKMQTYRAEVEKQKGLVALHEKQEKTLEEELERGLKESGFFTLEEARALILRLGDEAAVKQECKSFFERYELYKSKRAETDTAKFADYDENAVENTRMRKLELQKSKDECNRKIATGEAELKRLLELKEKYLAFEKTLAEKEKQKNLCDELRALLRNNRFLEFIASEYLQEICVSASQTLLSLTSGRYFLRYDKEFKVGDNLDGGNLRAVKTLSGGETFLVSLSLALSLSGAICQKSLRPIEFFFLDEGFGTLDEKLVDTVMDVLGKLSKSFSVGLISHVEELKHRIDNKILVTGATDSHGSQIKMECF